MQDPSLSLAELASAGVLRRTSVQPYVSQAAWAGVPGGFQMLLKPERTLKLFTHAQPGLKLCSARSIGTHSQGKEV